MSARNFNYSVTLGAMAQKQPTALDALFYQEAPIMLALSHSVLQRRVEAEEVLRESFMLLWKNAAGYDPTLGDARAWLYSILRFRLQARSKAQATDKPSTVSNLPDIRPDAQHHLILAIGELEPVQQRAIILAYLQGKSYDNLSLLLGRPTAQLRIQVQQGLQQVSQQCIPNTYQLDQRQSTLIAEYALGLLCSSELTQAHALLQNNDDAARLSLQWEQALLELVDFLTPITPTPTGLAHIYRSLDLGVPQKRTLHNPSPNASIEAQAQEATAVAAEAIHPASTSRATAEHTIGESKSHPAENPAVIHTSITIDQDDVPPSYSSLLRTDQSSQNLGSAEPHKPEPTSATTATAPEATTAPKRPISRLRKRRQETIAQNSVLSETPMPEPSVETGHSVNSPGITHLERQLPAVFWPGLCVGLLLLSVLLAYQWYREARIPNVTVVEMQPVQGAILQAPGLSSSPAWSVTVDPQGNVLLIPQVHTEVQAEQSVQLWTQAPGQANSRSLGLIDPNRPITVPAALVERLENGQIFEMTLEQAGGSDTGQPQGPVLYIGSIVNFGKLPVSNPSGTPPQRS